jgi:hypothetical protein
LHTLPFRSETRTLFTALPPSSLFLTFHCRYHHPPQDTSGPSLNILMKLMAIISLVFADFFFAIK